MKQPYTLSVGLCLAATSSTAFTVDGTLIIQSGTVNIGNLTVDKTGSVIVNGGARLNTGAFVSQNTTPASTISNLKVCNGGVLSMTGTISQGEINITVADKGILLADGSWSSLATDTYFKIGAVSQDNIGGWLSNSQGSSKISWSILGASARSSSTAFLISTDLSEAVPAADLILESSSDGATFNPTTYTALASSGDHYTYTLPLPASNSYHRIHFLGDGASLYSIVLPPSGKQPTKSNYTTATVFSSTGQALRTINLLPATPVWQFELPQNLPTGIYFIRFSAPGVTPLTTRMIKTP